MFKIIDNASERIYILKCDNLNDDIRFFEESVNEFIKTDTRDMVIDMEEQVVISSILLAALIRTQKGMSDEHRDLSLKNCSQHMYRCIEMAGLESFFSFCNYI